jgi:hypothetical protein
LAEKDSAILIEGVVMPTLPNNVNSFLRENINNVHRGFFLINTLI